MTLCSPGARTEPEMPFWRNFHHWLHRKLSKWQLSVQPMIKISSKWHFRFSAPGLCLVIFPCELVPVDFLFYIHFKTKGPVNASLTPFGQHFLNILTRLHISEYTGCQKSVQWCSNYTTCEAQNVLKLCLFDTIFGTRVNGSSCYIMLQFDTNINKIWQIDGSLRGCSNSIAKALGCRNLSHRTSHRTSIEPYLYNHFRRW